MTSTRAADEVVPYRNGERSTEFLRSSGFSYLTFKSYNGYASYTSPDKALPLFFLPQKSEH